MPGFANFNFDPTILVTSGVKVVFIIIVAFIVIMILNRVIPRAIKARIPRRREENQQQLDARSDTLSGVVSKTVSFIIWIIAFITILGAVGINVAPIIAAVGVVGLAVGFAAQNIIRDYLHGFFIVMEDWYRVGEVADVAGKVGLVDDINLRRTVLRDANGTMHVIPNSNIGVASNMTRDWARINLDIGVGYGEDIEKVIAVIDEVCQGLQDDEEWGPQLLTTPRAMRVNNLGDSSVDIKVMGDTLPMARIGLMGELRKRIKVRFDQEGIEIPWPHTMVYFGNSAPKEE